MSDRNVINVRGELAGAVWFIGYLFTLGFVPMVWWRAILAIMLWPYFLGVAAR